MIGPERREQPSSIGAVPDLAAAAPDLSRRARLPRAARPRDARALPRDRVRVRRVHGVLRRSGTRRHERYVLGPPLQSRAGDLPASESTINPTFELAYWRFGLETAQRWRERLGLPREPRWDRVIDTPVAAADARRPVRLRRDGARRATPTRASARPPVAARRLRLPAGVAGVDPESDAPHARLDLGALELARHLGLGLPAARDDAPRDSASPSVAVDALLMDTPKNRYRRTATTTSARASRSTCRATAAC